MAILTPKGVKAPHQLKGVRKVRISRDRRGAGSDEQSEIDELSSDVDTLKKALTTNFDNRISRDYYFVGKSIQFFGDSITFGVGVDVNDPLGITSTKWTEKFCELMNSQEINDAISGSLYTAGYNEVKSITQSVRDATLSGDFVFMCGGVNDWQLGVPLSEFKSALDDCFGYLQSNYDGTVIVVSPFNVIKNLVGSPITSLYNYSKILCEKALEYGFDFIDGSKMSLLTTRSASTVIQSQYADGLHPSGFGHYLIAHEMRFCFTHENWKTYTPTAGIYFWSGEYLVSLGVPIWSKVITCLTISSQSGVANIPLDSTMKSSDVIIQRSSGCIMFDNRVATLPFLSSGVGTLFSDTTGLFLQTANNFDITNGNIFLDFIRTFDISNRKTF